MAGTLIAGKGGAEDACVVSELKLQLHIPSCDNLTSMLAVVIL